MLGTPTGAQTPPLDSSRSALDFVHSLLSSMGEEYAHLAELLPTDETLVPPMPGWVEALDRGIRQERLHAAAGLVRRLAHDFGNILTGILGFSELGLAQPLAPSSPLHAYLTEIHRGAENGAHYINQLRTFARRQATSTRSCPVAAVLAEEEKRLRPLLGADIRLRLDCPEDLPLVAIDYEPLRQALTIVFDNAREAISGVGVIEVSVRTVRLNALEVREVFGEVRPGEHLEICVADSGVGLTLEAQRQLFREAFFSTKPRKRGFGLAMAYGILSAHRGGLDLLRRPEGGTIARLVLPVAVEEAKEKNSEAFLALSPCLPVSSSPSTTLRHERGLDVDAAIGQTDSR